MTDAARTQAIETHLVTLCDTCGNRHVGSLGNRQATAYAEGIPALLGFEVRMDPLACLEGAA